MIVGAYADMYEIGGNWFETSSRIFHTTPMLTILCCQMMSSELNFIFQNESPIPSQPIFLLFIKGSTAPPSQKLACFVLYLKISNIVLKNVKCIL